MQMVMWIRSPGLVLYDEVIVIRLQVGQVLRDGKGSMLIRSDTRPSLHILDVAMRFNQIRIWLRNNL